MDKIQLLLSIVILILSTVTLNENRKKDEIITTQQHEIDDKEMIIKSYQRDLKEDTIKIASMQHQIDCLQIENELLKARQNNTDRKS